MQGLIYSDPDRLTQTREKRISGCRTLYARTYAFMIIPGGCAVPASSADAEAPKDSLLTLISRHSITFRGVSARCLLLLLLSYNN